MQFERSLPFPNIENIVMTYFMHTDETPLPFMECSS